MLINHAAQQAAMGQRFKEVVLSHQGIEDKLEEQAMDAVAKCDRYKQAAELLAVLIHNTDGLMPVRMRGPKSGDICGDWLHTSAEILQAALAFVDGGGVCVRPTALLSRNDIIDMINDEE